VVLAAYSKSGLKGGQILRPISPFLVIYQAHKAREVYVGKVGQIPIGEQRVYVTDEHQIIVRFGRISPGFRLALSPLIERALRCTPQIAGIAKTSATVAPKSALPIIIVIPSQARARRDHHTPNFLAGLTRKLRRLRKITRRVAFFVQVISV
jgi:hypothetical protein